MLHCETNSRQVTCSSSISTSSPDVSGAFEPCIDLDKLHSPAVETGVQSFTPPVKSGAHVSFPSISGASNIDSPVLSTGVWINHDNETFNDLHCSTEPSDHLDDIQCHLPSEFDYIDTLQSPVVGNSVFSNENSNGLCPWFTNQTGSFDFKYPLIKSVIFDINVMYNSFDSVNVSNFSKVHELVFQSGKPNFAYCKIPVQSNFNVDLWEHLLTDYHDQRVVDFIKYGWPLNYTKDVLPNPPSRKQNYFSKYASFIDAYLVKELNKGAIYGPFKVNPLKCNLTLSPLFTVPKGEIDRRVIVDCSHGGPSSVNNGIPQDTFLNEPYKLMYPRHEEFISLLVRHGFGCAMWKLDLSRAFRQLVLDPHDLHLQGYEWKGDIYIDNRLIFGIRSSPQACQRTTNAVSYMLWKHGVHVVNYVDDFGGVSDSVSADQDYDFAVKLFKDLGLELSAEKCFPPSTIVTFLGKEYDSKQMTVRIPETKIQETKDILQSYAHKRSCTKRQLQQIIGKLAFISECVRSGRLFISRMLEVLRKYRYNHFRIRLTEEFRKDIKWWLLFLDTYNGISIIPEIDWSSPDAIISTDSCLQGIGGFNFSTFEYFRADIPSFLQNEPIFVLELYAIYIAIRIWASSVANKRIQLLCDNQSCVALLNGGSGRNKDMLNLARQIWYVCALNNVQIRLSYIPSSENRLSDLLSRWNTDDKYPEQFVSETSKYGPSVSEISVSNAMFRNVIDI